MQLREKVSSVIEKRDVLDNIEIKNAFSRGLSGKVCRYSIKDSRQKNMSVVIGAKR